MSDGHRAEQSPTFDTVQKKWDDNDIRPFSTIDWRVNLFEISESIAELKMEKQLGKWHIKWNDQIMQGHIASFLLIFFNIV